MDTGCLTGCPAAPPPPSPPSGIDLDLELDVIEEKPAARASSSPSVPPPLPTRRGAPSDARPTFSRPQQSLDAGHPELAEALEVLPSLAGLVLLRDPESGSLVVVHAEGPGARELRLARYPADDALLARATAALRPVVVSFGQQDALPPRHASFGRPRRVVIVSIVGVTRTTRCLGSIELVEPAGSLSLDAGAALRRIAHRCAQRLEPPRTPAPARELFLSSSCGPRA